MRYTNILHVCMQVKTRTGDSNDLIKDMQYKKILQLREKNVRHKL